MMMKGCALGLRCRGEAAEYALAKYDYIGKTLIQLELNTRAKDQHGFSLQIIAEIRIQNGRGGQLGLRWQCMITPKKHLFSFRINTAYSSGYSLNSKFKLVVEGSWVCVGNV
jgi:hypothetical protein